MLKKIFSILLLIFFCSSSFLVYATEDFENSVETEEVFEENEETEFDENEEDEPEENQEEQTENDVLIEEYFENSLDLLDSIDKNISVLCFIFAVWLIIDFVRHAFFTERR